MAFLLNDFSFILRMINSANCVLVIHLRGKNLYQKVYYQTESTHFLNEFSHAANIWLSKFDCEDRRLAITTHVSMINDLELFRQDFALAPVCSSAIAQVRRTTEYCVNISTRRGVRFSE